MRCIAASLLFAILFSISAPAAEQPNILWLTAEDIGPHLGCYGDDYADTPHLDAYAKNSLLYQNAWSNAPVCAPARTTLISGLYPPSTGAENMRSLTRLPADFAMYPDLMRKAGYFCINPGKEDYNLRKQGRVWDQANKKNPWPELKQQQPFMAVFNYTATHESKIRNRPHDWVHDPAKAPLPEYHPDVQEAREDWAQYYDNITVMDKWFADQIARLEEHGLSDSTIVFFYGDHGSGMPRNKRWPYNSGLRVPLLISVPEKFSDLLPDDSPRHGETDRLVSFVDFAPTILSLAGSQPAEYLQGQAFLGKFAADPPKYLFGFRGRMDERLDLVRTVRTQRYQYIRNYMPHLPYGQYLEYMFQTPTTRVWKELYEAGKLNEFQSQFWEPKPPEELYDLQSDPDEVRNLVDSQEHQQILNELRKVHQQHVMQIRDVGFLPEDELHSRAPKLSPYELGHDPKLYPLDEIFAMAQQASLLDADAVPDLIAGMDHKDSAVRYWAALGLLARGKSAIEQGHSALAKALKSDDSPSVRNVAAEALARFGTAADRTTALNWLIDAADGNQHGPYVSLAALNAIDRLDEIAAPIAEKIKDLPKQGDWVKPRGWNYNARAIEHILSQQQAEKQKSSS